jgi:hypothetical protein
MAKTIMRLVAGFVCIAAIGAFGWLASLPNKAECVASGRVVDPTERHCERPGGYQQLQEHALFHASEVLGGALILLAGGYVVRLYLRRRSSDAAPTARSS